MAPGFFFFPVKVNFTLNLKLLSGMFCPVRWIENIAFTCFSQRGRLVVGTDGNARQSWHEPADHSGKKHVHHLFSPLIAANRAGSMMCQIKMRLLELFCRSVLVQSCSTSFSSPYLKKYNFINKYFFDKWWLLRTFRCIWFSRRDIQQTAEPRGLQDAWAWCQGPMTHSEMRNDGQRDLKWHSVCGGNTATKGTETKIVTDMFLMSCGSQSASGQRCGSHIRTIWNWRCFPAATNW